MAAAAAATADGPAPKKGPSLVVQIAVLLVMTLVAMGLGYVSVGFMAPAPVAEPKDEAAPAADHAPAPDHGEKKDEKGGGEAAPAPASVLPNAVALSPITTNLAAPTDTWIRAEFTLVFDGAPDPAIAEAVHQDLLGYLRTLKLHQLSGASSFRHLRADLEERARIRSDAKVKSVLVRTLIFE